MLMNIVAIIVTFNPDQKRFIKVFYSAITQVDRIIIVDNNSHNKDFIKSLCNSQNNCEFIEIGFNSGVAHALRFGVNYAKKYNTKWLLFLDDDTILLENAVIKAMMIISDLPEAIKQRIGAVLLTFKEGNCDINEIKYGIFAGSLVKSEIAIKTCCRDEFFLDSADHDMYSRIRELRYLTLTISCKLVDHKLGKIMWIPVVSNILCRPTYYEPPWRYYYIVRNSTRLLIEGRIDSLFYIRQIIDWGIKIIFVDGFKKFIKPFGLGLLHALLNELGHLDTEILK
jgi:rhamnosyltransferase